MSILKPEVFQDSNLSLVWGRAYLHLIDRPERQHGPLVLSITDMEKGHITEDTRIRQVLEEELERYDEFSPKTSAMLIFPYNAWLGRGCPACEEFSKWYLNAYLPRLKARDARRNGKGTYFERMIAASGSKRSKGVQNLVVVNQLEHIVKVWKREQARGKHPRLSALQVACFDPIKDHSGAIRAGFPCLQQISFSYDEDKLILSATYPTEWFFNRAYGNYLGLCHLGFFMANELGLKFSRLNCFINHPELGDISKANLQCLTKSVQRLVMEADIADESSWFNNFELV